MYSENIIKGIKCDIKITHLMQNKQKEGIEEKGRKSGSCKSIFNSKTINVIHRLTQPMKINIIHCIHRIKGKIHNIISVGVETAFDKT